jgi:hypothetical protein
MKKIEPKSYYESVSNVIFFLGDFENLIEKIEKYFETDQIVLSDNEYEYSDFDELIRKKGHYPKKIQIKALNPKTHESIDCMFDDRKVDILAHGSDRMFLLGYELNEFLTSPKVMFPIKNPYYLGLVTSASLGFVGYGIDFATGKIKNPEVINLWLILFSFWLTLKLIYLSISRINLIRKHDYGFFKRNKDKLLVSVISLTVGAIITFISTR